MFKWTEREMSLPRTHTIAFKKTEMFLDSTKIECICRQY